MLGSPTRNVAIFMGLCVPSVAIGANLTAQEDSMAGMDVGAYSFESAKAHCDSLGNSWQMVYTNRKKGVMYCLKKGTSSGSNCNQCNTYRIIVWKDGGGEEKHCSGRYSYNTKAGYVYPAHVSPCRCDAPSRFDKTLGKACYKWNAGGGYTEAWARAQCKSLGNAWRIDYVNKGTGSLYCLKGISSGNNCNNCGTYRIIVFKDGGGENKHCNGQPYNTKAGYVYPAHVSPCRCDATSKKDYTLGGPCYKANAPMKKPKATLASAKAYCNAMSGWRIDYTNQNKGVLYCLKSGTSSGSNCNNCGTYRIVVFKDGGGEEKHCAGRFNPGYNTKAGFVYPAHTSPCACNAPRKKDFTLGNPCEQWAIGVKTTTTSTTTTTTTTKLFPVKMATWSFPEFISWTIIKGGKIVCKHGGYDDWYAEVNTDCMLAKGEYKVVCMDKYGEGFRGGYLQVAGRKFCYKDYMWNAGRKKTATFRVR